MVLNGYQGRLAGIGTARESYDAAVWFGREQQVLYGSSVLISSATVDAGNSPTTELRAGLLLTKSSGEYVQWTGTGLIEAVVVQGVSTLDDDGATDDVFTEYMVAGPVKASDLLINGSAFVGAALEHLARQQMMLGGRFVFDDDLDGTAAMLPVNSVVEEAKTASYTVTADDNGKELTNLGAAGAITFTLPAIEAGLKFRFRNRSSGNNITISRAGSDTISTSSDDAATSVSLNTLGTTTVIYANAAGNKWYHGTSNL